jgi:putative CocE/NonD family hydrolase
MTYPVKIDRRVFVPMQDGTRIALTLYLPDAPADGPFPAVLESLPYRKDDDCFTRDYRTYTYLAERGLAGVRIDIRGTGASTGIIVDEYVEQEQLDNLAVMEWLETQEWCDGNLGMWGISWGGFSALQAAMLRPPQLKAIAAMHATHDRFACDVHYTGGSAHAAEQLDWPGSMVTTNALPPDPDVFGEGWYEEWMRRLDATPQWSFEWLNHQHRDPYWLHGSPAADYPSIECPTLLIGGWLDGYVDGMLAMTEHLTCPTRTVIGPWGHYRPATGVPAPTLDHFDLLARWFGHHLRDDENGVMAMPPVTIYVRTAPPYDAEEVSGMWRSELAWPPADRQAHVFELDEMEHGSTEWSGPQWVGSHAPFWDRAGFRTNDSSEDDAVSMHFSTPPLSEPMEILGSPLVSARVTTNREVGLLAARLLTVDPDGHGHLICRASRNLAFHADLSSPESPRPGEPMDIVIHLPELRRSSRSAGASVFRCLAPTSRWSGALEGFTLIVDPSRSSVTLPLVGPRPAEQLLDIPWMTDLPPAPSQVTRSISEWKGDRQGDRSVFRRVKGDTERQPGLTYTTDQWWTVSVGDEDPASTHAHIQSRVTLERPGWSVTTEGSIDISAVETFEVTIELSARHNREEVFRRRWKESIPRCWA